MATGKGKRKRKERKKDGKDFLYVGIVIKIQCVFINFIQKGREARLDYLEDGGRGEMTGHLAIYNGDSGGLERSTFILAIVIYFIPKAVWDGLSIRATINTHTKEESVTRVLFFDASLRSLPIPYRIISVRRNFTVGI